MATRTRASASNGKKSNGAAATTPTAPEITKQPRSKHQAANEAGMFLRTDDSWSTRYFDPNDLYYMDRELFG